ncbi:MAG TPA: GNAT family N-acetyltransferase [Acidimicrobiia bacterium]
MSGRPELREITPENVGAAVRIEVRPEQSDFVAPVVYSLAEAYAQPDVAWPRLVVDGGQAVAFVMGAFDPSADPDFFRCGIWRLNVGAEHQGKGYGRFAVESVLDEARLRGQVRATVLWVPGEAGPEGFWREMGFEPTGEDFHGQVVGERYL